MAYQTLKRGDPQYPRRLIERLGNDAPDRIYYYGPLSNLKRFTMAVISGDKSCGMVWMTANQLLFTIREYELNYIGGWHSMMEDEIFRLGLYRDNVVVTLFSSKGLDKETFDSYLLQRYYPPMEQFPERDEYFRRAKDGELLMLSIAEPTTSRTLRKNIMERNFIACMLADVVFVPFAAKGTKTFTMVKRILRYNIPIFTTTQETNIDLHNLGVPALTRNSVKRYLDGLGAPLPKKVEPPPPILPEMGPVIVKHSRVSDQLPLWKKKK